jgi:hypothetical protein
MPVLEGWYKPLAGLVSRRLQGELGIADAGLPMEALRLADDIIMRIERRNREESAVLAATCQVSPPAPVTAGPRPSDLPEVRVRERSSAAPDRPCGRRPRIWEEEERR